MSRKTIKKKKGSLLIEAVASIMILMIASTMVMTSIIGTNKSKIRREQVEEANRVAYSIMNELKYNYTYSQVKNEILKVDSYGVLGSLIGLRYSDDILLKLTTDKLFALERGTDITIEIINRNPEDNIMLIKVDIKQFAGGNLIDVERTFNKSWWM